MSQSVILIPRKTTLIFACFLVFYEFLTYIANDMILPGMIHVVRSFHAPESAVASSLTAYLLGGASLQLFLGPLSDFYGRRPMMLLGAFLFVLFTFLITLSNSMEQFLIARFFQGMGLCFIAVIGYATIQELCEEMDAIRLIAIMANAAILAPLLGPLIGSIIIHYKSWQFIFMIIGFGGLIALWGLWCYMPESLMSKRDPNHKNLQSSLSFKVVYLNYKALFSNRKFCATALALGLVGVPCLTWIALSPIILIIKGKLTVIQYGLWQLPIFGATILGNWCLHRLTYKYGLKKIILIGSKILLFGILLTALLPYMFGEHYYYLIPGTVIYFFALGVVTSPLNRYCLFITKVSKGTASAIISLNVMLIGALGIEIANYMFKKHSNLSLGLLFILISALFLLMLFIALKPKKN